MKISCLPSHVQSVSYSVEKEVKWEMSWLTKDTFVPPAPSPQHTYSLTHTYTDVNLIWKNRKYHHQFLLFLKWLFLLDCPLLEFMKYALSLYSKSWAVCNLIMRTIFQSKFCTEVQVCKIRNKTELSIKCSGQLLI